MKTKALYNSLMKAREKLKETEFFPSDDPHRESTIQRFEYTFELAWKLMSSVLKDQSLETHGVKNIIREAARLGLIDNVERWFEFALARNKASHIYLEEIAEQVYKVATSDFLQFVDDLIESSEQYV